MLICHNCSTIQEAGTDHCRHCRMPGRLAPWTGAAQFRPATPARAHCPNCGCEDPGEEEKCMECRFPLPTAQGPGRNEEEGNSRFRLRAG